MEKLNESKIVTAMKHAQSNGCLIVNSLNEMKVIGNTSENGKSRIEQILLDYSNMVIGFYKCSDKFTPKQVERWMREDLHDAKVWN